LTVWGDLRLDRQLIVQRSEVRKKKFGGRSWTCPEKFKVYTAYIFMRARVKTCGCFSESFENFTIGVDKMGRVNGNFLTQSIFTGKCAQVTYA
jgi:hypothetical protein